MAAGLLGTLYAILLYCMLLSSCKCDFNVIDFDGIYFLSTINNTNISPASSMFAVRTNGIFSLPMGHEVLSHFIIHVEKRSRRELRMSLRKNLNCSPHVNKHTTFFGTSCVEIYIHVQALETYQQLNMKD